MRKFAISDIHGCSATFKALLQKIELTPKDELYLLGDFIDRGPDSKGVFDHIFGLLETGYSVHCLRGNHEAMLLGANVGLDKRLMWLHNGGAEALTSFGVHDVNDIPMRYRQFIANMPHYFEVDNYLLVHAGFNFYIPAQDIFEAKESMLWIRKWYNDINKAWLGNRIIVHGHTPMPVLKIQQQANNLHNLPALDIDAGCVFARQSSKLGQLCAFELQSKQLYFQACIDSLSSTHKCNF